MPNANAPDSQHIADNPYRRAIAAARTSLGGVILLSAVLNVLMLTGSIYMLQVYDRVLPGGSVPTLVVLFAIVIVLFAFLGLYDFLRTRVLSRIALQLDNHLSGPAFRMWLRAGLPGGGKGSDAQVMHDLDTLRGFLSGPVVASMADVLFVPLFLGVLFLIHPWLGLLTIAGAGVGVAIALVNRAVMRPNISQSVELDSAERNFIDRSARNAEAIEAMGMQASISAHWQRLHRAALASAQAGSDPSEVLAATSRAFRMLLQSAILTLGALLVIRGEMSGGMIIASSVLSGRALAPVDQLIGQWRVIGRAGAAHKRLLSTFDAARPEPARIALPDPTGKISVSGLTKLAPSQPGTDPVKILSDIAFALAPGDAMGVIGNSASGKSTLARILVGAGHSDSGEVRLDGATLDQWDPEQLGRQIGYLPQMLEMLPGTIRDNIARFDPKAQDADVIAAATLTGIHSMILKLPDGYATRLSDPQSPPMLSGGQLQRLGLARAVFGMPRLVVLDEPNANLDRNGDAALTHTIRTLRAAGSTVIVMAHRPSVLVAVNKLMILNAGRVEAFDDRETLLATEYKGQYKGKEANTPAPVQATNLSPHKQAAAGNMLRKLRAVPRAPSTPSTPRRYHA
ncbi:type I secretion system permease/ATPase (plasmid) [Pseudorhodobacter turbinis]|uniref:Type I secretion system permease/ATPase n=1 Tax=Pseudorhodobacter turbinis TaxID=2500533 RepID=A0A4P8ELY8_9RHOB|nr:type I secretion system permease/ATPase [Pseudorhodobacter turbinis]QCO58116.1 type I secretion system permease/ATPase [Pseudorhodobacter turbinis]